MTGVIFDRTLCRHALKKLAVLQNPNSLNILKFINEQKEVNVTAIYKYLNLPQPIVSIYLSNLRKEKIVLAKRSGQQMIYSINTIVCEQILKGIECCC